MEKNRNPELPQPDERKKAIPASLRRLSIASALIPAIAHAFFVFRFAHPLPVWEQWYFVEIFDRFYKGHEWISFLLTPYNDHLNTIPFLFSLLLGLLTHWNILAEIYLGFFLLIACFGILMLWLRQVGPKRYYALLPLLSIFWFSLRSYEVILNGFNVSVHYVSALLALLSIEFLRRGKDSALCFAAALFTAFLLTFSWGGGMLIWPAGLLLLGKKAQGRRALLKFGIWISSAIGSLALLHHFRVMPDYFKTIDIAAIIRFFLTLTANPTSEKPGFFYATVILTGCLAIAFSALLRSRRITTRELVFAAWGTYSFLNILAVSLTRSHGGVDLALPSRYSFVVTPFIISFIVLITDLDQRIRMNAWGKKLFRGALGAFLLISAVSSVRCSIHSWHIVEGWKKSLLAPLIRMAEESPDFLSPGMVQELICAKWQHPTEGLAIMKHFHLAVFRHPGTKTDDNLEELLRSDSFRDSSQIEYSAGLWEYDRPSRCFLMKGTAIDLANNSPPCCVFIEGPGGDREFGLMGYQSTDSKGKCDDCGFRFRVPRKFMYEARHNLRLNILSGDGVRKVISLGQPDFSAGAWKKLQKPPRKRKAKIHYSTKPS